MSVEFVCFSVVMFNLLNIKLDVMILYSFVMNTLKTTTLLSKHVLGSLMWIIYVFYLVYLLVVMKTVIRCTMYII
jgi:hypothetical protein